MPAGGRLYRRFEARLGPALPRPLRAAWRRLIGRPPLPEPPRPRPARPLAASEQARVAEIVNARRQPDVVVLPIIAWSFRYQRPQQIAREMAAAGRRVFWIDPEALQQAASPWDEGPRAGVVAIRDGVFEIALSSPRALDQFKDALDAGDVSALFDALDELRREAGIVSAVVVVQLPFWTPLALHAREAFGWRVVYDCMDDHAGFSSNAAQMLASEQRLVAAADLVVASSQRLGDALRARARVLVTIPNACDDAHFAAPPEALPDEVADVQGPVVGYFGAISEWFDFELVRHAARSHPEWTFVLIGSTWGAGPHDDLRRLRNVRFLGEKPYATLPGYLARFDVATIPFRVTPLIEATSPVKFYEYLAAGKPVVASRLPELEPHVGLARLADGPEAFTRALEDALRESAEPGEDERVAARRRFAGANTWQLRASELLRAADATFPLVSVVVVTWNNLSFTRECLASLFADRTWPRVQLVVVDNASRDGTVPFLDELAKRHDGVLVLRNADNRGFAVANNQGVAAARGEYVVLLNNDTVVTPGWLPRLVEVLRRDPRLGMIGPVSDGTWNEALHLIGKEERARLPEFAEAWARQHEGQVYPMRMLAMFCVAARRAVLDEVGPLDERFGIGMFEDDDYAHRLRLAGYRLACAEEVFIHHAGQASFDKLPQRDAIYEANRRVFEDKWRTTWQPYLGDRARTRRWRDEVEALVAARTDDSPPVVVLAPDANDAGPPIVDALGAALARRGRLVFVHVEPEDGKRAGLLRLGAALVVAGIPLEAFERLTGVVVVAPAGRDFELAWFRSPSRVVRFGEGWQAHVEQIADEATG